MSLIGKYFSGLRFRTTTPSLTVGEEVNVFVNRYEDHATDGTDANEESTGVGVARIGDTLLYVDGVGPEHVDLRVRVRVTEFDEDTATGHGEYVETTGQSSYPD